MMAGDRQFTKDSIKLIGRTKIYEVPGDIVGAKRLFVGFAGRADQIGPSVMWLLNPAEKPHKLRDTEIIGLTDKGEILHTQDLVNWIELTQKFFAIGSGAGFAISAMECGKDPVEAIKVASKYDLQTGKGYTKLIMNETK
jgi:hypothetical protein